MTDQGEEEGDQEEEADGRRLRGYLETREAEVAEVHGRALLTLTSS